MENLRAGPPLQPRRHDTRRGTIPSLTSALVSAMRALADILIPPRCLACQYPLASHDTICAQCWSRIAFIHPPVCDRLGIPLPFASSGLDTGPLLSAAALANPPNYDRARAVAQYGDVMRHLIHGFKYADKHDSRRLFGRWLHQAARDLVADAEIILPVPLHPRRLLARRYNQSAILASELAKHVHLPCEFDILRRRRKTRSQVGLTRDQRRQNLQNAFSVPPEAGNVILGKHLLLVDDVITTGTTIDTCARVLKRAGAASVDVAALAIVTDDSRINP